MPRNRYRFIFDSNNKSSQQLTAGMAIFAGSIAMNPKRLMSTSKLSAAKLSRPASSTGVLRLRFGLVLGGCRWDHGVGHAVLLSATCALVTATAVELFMMA